MQKSGIWGLTGKEMIARRIIYKNSGWDVTGMGTTNDKNTGLFWPLDRKKTPRGR